VPDALPAVGIYGLGRFGAFWGAALARITTVVGYSRDPARPAPDGVQRVTEQELLESPVLILCVAISALPEVLQRIAPRLQPGTLVMDTCSVKARPAEWMASLLPEGVQVLATHPMFGPDSAVAGLRGLPMVLCPVRVDPGELQRWRRVFAGLGLAVREMSPEEHDREAAATQGLTHFLGRVLAEMDLRPSEIGSVGYRKLLEIIEQTCNDSRQLFLDLQRYNPYTREMRRRLEESFGRIRAQLDADTRPGRS
jgi:prephenate dehydrogenase